MEMPAPALVREAEPATILTTSAYSAGAVDASTCSARARPRSKLAKASHADERARCSASAKSMPRSAQSSAWVRIAGPRLRRSTGRQICAER